MPIQINIALRSFPSPPMDPIPFEGMPTWAIVGECIILVRDWAGWLKNASFVVMRANSDEVLLGSNGVVMLVPRAYWMGLTNSLAFLSSPNSTTLPSPRTRFEREFLV